MITVKPSKYTRKYTKYKFDELTRDKHSNERNAFIGRCGNGPVDELYIIGWDFVYLANDPSRTWSTADLYVWKFVDLVINVQE